MSKVDTMQGCAACGATIYPEMIDSGLAERVAGQLLCPHCSSERRRKLEAESRAEDRGLAFSAADGASAGSTTGGGNGPTADRIQHTSQRANARRNYQRALARGVGHATRCRTFHCKLSDAAFAHLDEQINDWADSNGEVEIKFATSSIGTIEGKHADPHLIVNVFY